MKDIKDVTMITFRAYNEPPSINGAFKGQAKAYKIPVHDMNRDEALEVAEVLKGHPLVIHVLCHVKGGHPCYRDTL